MIDYHVHPNYSQDAEGALHEFCNVAAEMGLDEIAFTTHVDSDPKTNDCYVVVKGRRVDIRSNYWLEDYEESIREVAAQYVDRNLVVRLGAEVDIYPGFAANLPENFYKTDFDLILGSVHLIDHTPLSTEKGAKKIFSKHSYNELADTYFPLLLDTLDDHFIDVIGHLDIYRRYGMKYYGEEISTIWKSYIDELSNRMIHENVGFEVNTSSWRKGLGQPMPTESLVRKLIGLGVKIVTTGSDAHHPKHVGYGIKRAEKILAKCGIAVPTRFESRKAR